MPGRRFTLGDELVDQADPFGKLFGYQVLKPIDPSINVRKYGMVVFDADDHGVADMESEVIAKLGWQDDPPIIGNANLVRRRVHGAIP
jgi:hypothetical protein